MAPEPTKPDMPPIGGDYTLLEKLGEGAFGEVYKALHELLGQEFAVKVLRPELSEDQDVRDRFLDEARALIRFSHPNVVQVRHVGEHGGRLFLVMDLIQGLELGEIMKRDGAFEESRAVNLCRQILSGLEAAHAAGIVHRDLKPSNMIVEKRADGSEHLRILDFGLSKFSAIDGEKGAHRSITGTIVGTLAYMSPEQIKGDPDIDGRSDLFATALVLQEMLQGHHPYPGESGIVVAAKLLRDPIPPIDGKPASKLSAVTKGALARALERDRDARFASVTAFAQALEGKGPPSDTSRVTTVQDAARELARREAAAAKAGKGTDGAKAKKKSLVPILGGLLLVGAAAAAFLVMNSGKSDNPPKDPSSSASAGTSSDPSTPSTTPVRPDPGSVPPVDVPSVDVPSVDPQPDPAPDPATPPGVVPDPAVDPQPDPTPPTKPPEPAPDPAPPDPATPVEAPQPAPIEPAPVAPAAGGQLSPAQCCTQAWARFQAGDWSAARVLYQQAVEKSDLKADEQVASLRGAAESYLREADTLARSGKLKEAYTLLEETLAWLGGRYDTYEKVPQAMEAVRLPLGFARMHTAETRVEIARWAAIGGDKAAAAEALAKAKTDYDFALHQLDRDGVRYWEFLIRRAQMHWLSGNSTEMIADVAHTTKTNNDEVPAHMWVAHATAARRVAQAYALRGDADAAYTWAQKASKVAEDGASWQELTLSRQQWLDLARVLFVQAVLSPKGTDPTALHGKIRYWVSEAAKRDVTAWLPPDLDKARLTTGRAMERYLQGLVFAKRGQAGEAKGAFTEAAQLLAAAVTLGRQVAAAGGLLEDPLPHEVRAAVAAATGDAATAAAAQKAARAAHARNPD